MADPDDIAAFAKAVADGNPFDKAGKMLGLERRPDESDSALQSRIEAKTADAHDVGYWAPGIGSTGRSPMPSDDLSASLPAEFQLTILRKFGSWWTVTCEDYPGLYIANRDLAVALADVPQAFATLIQLDGLTCVVPQSNTERFRVHFSGSGRSFTYAFFDRGQFIETGQVCSPRMIDDLFAAFKRDREKLT